MIGHAVLFKVALIRTGCDNRAVVRFQHAEHIIGVVRILNADAPCTAVLLGAQQMHVAAQRHHAAGHAVFFEDFHNAAGRKALGNAAQVNFLLVSQRQRLGALVPCQLVCADAL